MYRQRDCPRGEQAFGVASGEDRSTTLDENICIQQLHGRARTVYSHLRYAVAARLSDDGLLVEGFCSQLIPRSISHALRVCLIADLPSRVKRAAVEGGLSAKDAGKQIRRMDEKKATWVLDVLGSTDPWGRDLYDLLIPTDKSEPKAVVDFVTENLAKEIVQPTPTSKLAVEDFLIASRVETTLADRGHYVGVESVSGAVTLTINKHVLMLGRLEDELKALAAPVEGVRSVATRVGKDFYKPDIYRKTDFEKPSRVLLVDDEHEFVQTLSERLEMRDVGSAVAYDGESALRMVEDEEPEVIILDLRMPGIDGIEVLRRVKGTILSSRSSSSRATALKRTARPVWSSGPSRIYEAGRHRGLERDTETGK